jgi:hypothetical protein
MLVANRKSQLIFRITASSILLLLAVFLFTPDVALADEDVNIIIDDANIIEGVEITSEAAGLTKTDPRVIVGRIIKVFLGILGVIAICIVLYAGYLWMTAGGNPDQVQKAKDWLRNGFIGLLIILASYSLVTWIVNSIRDAMTDGSVSTSSLLPATGYNLSGGAFGKVLQSHSPSPGQTDVPRNTMVLATFKVPVNPATIIDMGAYAIGGDDFIEEGGNYKYTPCPPALTQCDGSACPADVALCGPIQKANFRMYRCADMPDWPVENKLDDCDDVLIDTPLDETTFIDGYVVITPDHRTMIFNPYSDSVENHLGTSTEDVSYVVHLQNGIQRQDPAGFSVFSTANPEYKWMFTTSTLLDLTPPQIYSVVPKDEAGINPEVVDFTLDAAGKVYRNQMIYVNFNEPVIPPLTTLQDCSAGNNVMEAQVEVQGDPPAGCVTSHVDGSWITGINQYKTIKFKPSTECEGVDINSCGEPVFCLPADSTLNGTVLAAQVIESLAQFGTGIMDLAANSLDGNFDGEANGQNADPTLNDNYNWSFLVGTTIDLIPPQITALDPMNAAGYVSTSDPINASFDKALDAATADTEMALVGQDFVGWFDPNLVLSHTLDTIRMSHAMLTEPDYPEGEVPPTGESLRGPLYMPIITAKLQDSRQNCFTPSRYTKEGGIDSVSLQATEDPEPEELDFRCFTTGSGDYGVSCCPEEDVTDSGPSITYKIKRQTVTGTNPLNQCFLTDVPRD